MLGKTGWNQWEFSRIPTDWSYVNVPYFGAIWIVGIFFLIYGRYLQSVPEMVIDGKMMFPWWFWAVKLGIQVRNWSTEIGIWPNWPRLTHNIPQNATSHTSKKSKFSCANFTSWHFPWKSDGSQKKHIISTWHIISSTWVDIFFLRSILKYIIPCTWNIHLKHETWRQDHLIFTSPEPESLVWT